MRNWTAASLATILCLGMNSPAGAGRNDYQISVGGARMSCQSWRGQPVKIVQNPAVDTLGRAYSNDDGQPVIELNPGGMGTFSPKVQQWWFAHECAHHQLPPQLNSEKRADCVAGKRVKREGLNATEAMSFVKELNAVQGSALGHLPGPERAKHVLKCAGFQVQATA